MLKLFLAAGTICIIISGIFIGAWTDARRQRVNFHSETEAHRNFRTKIAMASGAAGVISFGIAGAIWYF